MKDTLRAQDKSLPLATGELFVRNSTSSQGWKLLTTWSAWRKSAQLTTGYSTESKEGPGDARDKELESLEKDLNTGLSSLAWRWTRLSMERAKPDVTKQAKPTAQAPHAAREVSAGEACPIRQFQAACFDTSMRHKKQLVVAQIVKPLFFTKQPFSIGSRMIWGRTAVSPAANESLLHGAVREAIAQEIWKGVLRYRKNRPEADSVPRTFEFLPLPLTVQHCRSRYHLAGKWTPKTDTKTDTKTGSATKNQFPRFVGPVSHVAALNNDEQDRWVVYVTSLESWVILDGQSKNGEDKSAKVTLSLNPMRVFCPAGYQLSGCTSRLKIPVEGMTAPLTVQSIWQFHKIESKKAIKIPHIARSCAGYSYARPKPALAREKWAELEQLGSLCKAVLERGGLARLRPRQTALRWCLLALKRGWNTVKAKCNILAGSEIYGERLLEALRLVLQTSQTSFRGTDQAVARLLKGLSNAVVATDSASLVWHQVAHKEFARYGVADYSSEIQMAFLDDVAMSDSERAKLKEHFDKANAAGVDPGMRTLVTIYDLANSRLIRIGHGLAQRMDMRYQRPRRRLQAEISSLLKSSAIESDPRIQALRQAMRILQEGHDRHVEVCGAVCLVRCVNLRIPS